jgi:hypothetical protein
MTSTGKLNAVRAPSGNGHSDPPLQTSTIHGHAEKGYYRSRCLKPSRHIPGCAPNSPRQPVIASPGLFCASFPSQTILPRNPPHGAYRSHPHASVSRLRENRRDLPLLSPPRRSPAAASLLACPQESASLLPDVLPRKLRATRLGRDARLARHLTAHRA